MICLIIWVEDEIFISTLCVSFFSTFCGDLGADAEQASTDDDETPEGEKKSVSRESSTEHLNTVTADDQLTKSVEKTQFTSSSTYSTTTTTNSTRGRSQLLQQRRKVRRDFSSRPQKDRASAHDLLLREIRNSSFFNKITMFDDNSDYLQLDDNVNYKSISCEQIPEDFLDKAIAKEHFSQFGPIRRFILRPKRFACTVDYETTEAAEYALMEGGSFNNHDFRIYFTPKEVPKPKMLDEYMDPDVQAELEAMGAVKNFSPQRQMEGQLVPPIQRIERRMKMTQKPPLDTPLGVKISPAMPSVTVNPTTRAEIEAILKKPAFTHEERYRVLDARDKLLRLTMNKTIDIKKAEATKGTCPDMCPEKERLMRQARLQVANFEMDSRGMLNSRLAVKQYSRSSADQESALPHELRPEPVLRMTMNYLLQNIMDLCDVSDTNLSDWFHFLWDRTRSIRKDITQQELCSQESVLLVEQCARFHIHCSARLIAEDPSVFDQKINTENLTKCLQSLKYMYHDLALKGERCVNEAEFRGYIILLNLQDSNFLWDVKQLPESVQKSDPVKFAIDVFLAMESNNYVKFFQLVRRTTYMNACILLRYFNQVRAKALEVIVKSYTSRVPVPFSLRHLMYILGFEDAESTAQFVEYYGLPTSRESDRVALDKNCFYHPDMPFLLDRAINVVEHKRISPVGEVVNNGQLDDRNNFDKHTPEDSFDERGYLLESALMGLEQALITPERQKGKKPVKFRDEINTPAENVFKIPSGSPPISPKQSTGSSVFGRSSFTTIFNQRIPPEEITPPRFQLPEPKSVFSSLLSTASSNSITPSSSDNETASFQKTPFTMKLGPGLSIFGGATATNTFTKSPVGAGLSARAGKVTDQEKQRKEAEEQKKKNFEDERKRKEEEEEEELRREREKLEAQMKRARKLDKASDEIYEDLIQEVLQKFSEEIAAEEILSYTEFLEKQEDLCDEILKDTVDEIAERTICEEYIVKRSIYVRSWRNLFKYFSAWRSHVREKITRRNVINNTPIWLPSQSVQRDTLKHAHQDATVDLKDRYLRGRPDDFNLSRPATNVIDLFAGTGQNLLLQMKKSRKSRILKFNYYWKLMICIPDGMEETFGFTAYIQKWLEGIFARTVERRDEKRPFFVEKNIVKNTQESLSVSLRIIKGLRMFQEDGTLLTPANSTADGIIFILTVTNFPNAKKRLRNLLNKIPSVSPGIPLVVIVYNGHSVTQEHVEEVLGLEKLCQDEEISSYVVKIFDENRRRSLTTLGGILEEGLKFCAKNYNPNFPLEMARTSVFLDETLGSVFWKRLCLSAQVNPKLAAISHNINFVISLYNDAIQRVRGICSSEMFSSYPRFPQELRSFVPPRIGESFLTWEYFPVGWWEPKRIQKITQFLDRLTLPTFTFSNQVFHSKQIEQELRKYLEGFMPKDSIDRVTYGIVEMILTTQIDETISWLRPVEIIVLERLTRIFQESRLPEEVIYDRSDLETYCTTPFWLSDDLLPGVPVELEEEDDDQPEVKKCRLNLDEILQQADLTLKRADERLLQRQKNLTASAQITQELDVKLKQEEETHRQMSTSWREKLRLSLL
ncbi:xmas [Sergentomyia squamirostris]